jgi:hypothetical protein
MVDLCPGSEDINRLMLIIIYLSTRVDHFLHFSYKHYTPSPLLDLVSSQKVKLFPSPIFQLPKFILVQRHAREIIEIDQSDIHTYTHIHCVESTTRVSRMLNLNV